MTTVLLMYEPPADHLERLRAAAPGATLLIAHSQDEAEELIREADAVLGNRWFYQVLPAATRLRWMQSNSMGVDLIVPHARRAKFVLTCSRGVYDDEVAEHAVALVLALTRGLHRARDAQSAHEWSRQPLRSLTTMKAMILGSGGVGRRIAELLSAFGAAVHAVRRSDAPEWRDDLSSIDILVMALPLTEETRHLVTRGELFALAPHAFVINVGRGPTLETAALVSALDSGHLGGAALDVFEEEPLPKNSPFWERRDILISPHVARSPETGAHRWQSLFEENLRRFVANEPLLNVVDLEKGY